jgi:integrase/recombinase XerC
VSLRQCCAEFLAWCDQQGVPSVAAVQPLHVAAWIEQQTRDYAVPTAKARLAALRHLFDRLVTGQVMPANLAGSVRGPLHVVRAGKTSVLAPEEARVLIDAIEITTHAGLRDRALIVLMVFTFERIGAALGMKVEDVLTENRRLWVPLREKGGKAMQWHHNLETYLSPYLEGAGLAEDPKRAERRHIGEGGANDKPLQHAHDAALRSPARGTQPRRGGEAQAVNHATHTHRSRAKASGQLIPTAGTHAAVAERGTAGAGPKVPCLRN